MAVSNHQEGGVAYNAVLFAIGNNHAGYLFPAAAPAAPLLVRVARARQGWVRQTALEILIECVEFSVDPEQFVDPSGAVVRTEDAILAAVQGMREDLEYLAREEAGICAGSARDLLELLDDEPAAGRLSPLDP